MTATMITQRDSSELEEIALRILRGQATVQISKELAIPQADLQALYETPEFQALVRDLDRKRNQNLDERLMEDGTKLMARIQDTGAEAYEKLMSLMRYSHDPKLQAWIAKNFLDRAGFRAPKRAIVQQQQALVIDPELAQRIIDARRESFKNERCDACSQKELPEADSDEDDE